MAEMIQSVPQFQYPDLLGSYLRGSLGAGEIQGQQLQNTAAGLNIDQLRIALQNQQMYQDVARGALQRDGALPGGPNAAGAQSPMGPTGGIQNGPQAGVSAPFGNAPSTIGGFTPSTLGALALLRGDDPLKTAQGVQSYQMTQAKLQAQRTLNLAKTVASSPDADKIVWNNPQLMQGWRNYAPKLGLNPNDPSALTPINARKAATMFYNDVAGQVGEAPLEMPQQYTNLRGPNGQLLQVDNSGKETEVTPQKLPGYSMEKRWNPQTGREEGVMVQTSPGGSPTPTIGSARGSGSSTGAGIGSTAGQTVDLGYTKPSDAELKAGMFASEMRSGLQTMNGMESSGFNLSAKARAAAISMATDESGGLMSQLLQQEVARHGLNKDEQTYLSAMMPMLQAAGHDQSGARLTTAQIRQNVESLLPMDTRNAANLAQVRKNREGFYNGLLTQASTVAQLPQYQGTLGADLKAIQAKGTQFQEGKIYKDAKGNRAKYVNGQWVPQ